MVNYEVLNAYQRRRNGRRPGEYQGAPWPWCSTLTSVGEMVGWEGVDQVYELFVLNAYQRRRNGREMLGRKFRPQDGAQRLPASEKWSVAEMRKRMEGDKVLNAYQRRRNGRCHVGAITGGRAFVLNAYQRRRNGRTTADERRKIEGECSTLTSVGEMVGGPSRHPHHPRSHVLNAYQRRRNGRRTSCSSGLFGVRAQRLPASEKWSGSKAAS